MNEMIQVLMARGLTRTEAQEVLDLAKHAAHSGIETLMRIIGTASDDRSRTLAAIIACDYMHFKMSEVLKLMETITDAMNVDLS